MNRFQLNLPYFFSGIALMLSSDAFRYAYFDWSDNLFNSTVFIMGFVSTLYGLINLIGSSE